MTIYPEMGSRKIYFNQQANIGIIGYGETIEMCFTDTARVMFSLTSDISNIHLTQVITFEFEESDHETALVTWLNLLIEKSQEHQITFGDFRLKREGNSWKATISGQKWPEKCREMVNIKRATLDMLSVTKIDHLWEARCMVDV